MGLKFYDNLLGEETAEVNLPYSGADTLQKFCSNLQKMPDDWYYRNRPLDYYHNSQGHRSNNIDKINFDNYILFSGCSHTYGIGLELETTYTYLLSKKLNVDYYNLGLGGTGIDVMFYNVITWLNKFPKPKCVFLQWTDHTRFLGFRTDGPKPIIQPEGHWSVNPNAVKVCFLGSDNGYFFSRAMIFHKLIQSKLASLGIPYVYVSFLGPDTVKIPENFFHVAGPALDKARDVSHFGIKTNEMYANGLAERYYEVLR